MQASNASGFRTRKFVLSFAPASFMTLKFFNLGLLQRYDLSFIYPFQGLSVTLIILTAAFLLRQITLQIGARLGR